MAHGVIHDVLSVECINSLQVMPWFKSEVNVSLRRVRCTSAAS